LACGSVHHDAGDGLYSGDKSERRKAASLMPENGKKYVRNVMRKEVSAPYPHENERRKDVVEKASSCGEIHGST
jgi:hypothetical protein